MGQVAAMQSQQEQVQQKEEQFGVEDIQCWEQELSVSGKQQSTRSLPSRIEESRELLL